ncbi:MAG: thioredoxin [Methanoculleaceae archaeon]
MDQSLPDDDELERLRQKRLAELEEEIRKRNEQPAGGEVITLDGRTFRQAVRSHPYLVVDFWAEWCGPCRMISPVVEELARELAGRVTFAKVNTDQNPRIAASYRITAIPTLLLFAGGRLVDQIVGVYPKEALKQRIASVFGRNAVY